jgi:hypothetical protein
MKCWGRCSEGIVIRFSVFAVLAAGCAMNGWSQTDSPSERTFPQSKDAVTKALKGLQSATAGRLPVLDGFVTLQDRRFDQYQRGYYQSTFVVQPASAGGSVVRVSTKITAWYADPVASRSGYRLLTSNGRLEADLLDQLSDALGATKTGGNGPSVADPALKAAADPAVSAPVPKFPATGGTFSSSLGQSLTAKDQPSLARPVTQPADADKDLQAEARNLEEIVKNQAHPKNLVAVRKSGTAVVATPSLTAKTLFLASAHDEFEMLDFNQDWVHVRVSGLSRGWIWRNSLEMPEGIPDVETHTGANAARAAAELFHVTREETALFPGDWEPLRSKSVKIISVEKADDTAKDTDPKLKLEFAKSVLDKSSSELAQKSQELAGVVLIFDAVDGGMIATTAATLQQWKAGKLSDAALWHQSFFDPPEPLSAAPSASQ